jgi:hypothetical protein
MANPLTLLLPVIPETDPNEIVKTLSAYGLKLYVALESVGTVHYARALMLDRSAPNLQPTVKDKKVVSKGPFVIAIITEYDHDFDRYIHDFVVKVGEVFDALLQFVPGGKEVIPVIDHETEFGNLLAENNVPSLLFQAYTATVQEVRDGLECEPGAPSHKADPNG